jgi:alpha-N-arabinofuranosidase
MKPERWRPNTVDALASASDDGRRLVLKTVNYDSVRHILLTRVQGTRAPAAANVKIWTIAAGLNDENSLAEPNKIRPVETTATYAPNMAFDLPPYSVMVVEITAR